MDDDVEREDVRRRRRSRLRWISVTAAAILAVAAVVTVLALTASKANGSDDESSPESSEENGKAVEAGEPNGEEKAPVPVEVREVESGTIAAYITSTANLVAENQVTILAEVEGRVARLLVEEGDMVGSGQILAVLVRDDAEIALKKAELKQTNATMAFDRARDLAEKDLISREEYDRTTMDHEIAQQEVAEAAWRLEKTTIRAPFGGKVSERMIQVGQNIRPADELFEITDLDPLIARIFLPERDILGLEEGRDVKVTLNAEPTTIFAGRIRQISPVVDTATGTVKVTVEATEPPETVRPGSFVTIDIVRETRESARLIPRQAVLRELQSAHVFVVTDEVAQKRDITLGLEEGDVVEATSGLDLGEKVVVAGQGGLRDGAKIKVLGQEEASEPEADSDAAEATT